MIDGPNASGYDNSISPNVLYVLATTISNGEYVVNECVIGSDPVALVRLGERMQRQFVENDLRGMVLHFRVVQAGIG